MARYNNPDTILTMVNTRGVHREYPWGYPLREVLVLGEGGSNPDRV
jgi:hypothetical protein